MNKITITGNMWNEMVAIQDQLVLMHNAIEDKQLYLSWNISPAIGMISCSLYSTDERGMVFERIDEFICYVDSDIEGHTKNDAMDKITEWEKKYGLLDAEH